MDWLSAGVSVLGSGLSALTGASSSKKIANAIEKEGQAQRAYLEKNKV